MKTIWQVVREAKMTVGGFLAAAKSLGLLGRVRANGDRVWTDEEVKRILAASRQG